MSLPLVFAFLPLPADCFCFCCHQWLLILFSAIGWLFLLADGACNMLLGYCTIRNCDAIFVITSSSSIFKYLIICCCVTVTAHFAASHTLLLLLPPVDWCIWLCYSCCHSHCHCCQSPATILIFLIVTVIIGVCTKVHWTLSSRKQLLMAANAVTAVPMLLLPLWLCTFSIFVS